jgi:hypothetical protein
LPVGCFDKARPYAPFLARKRAPSVNFEVDMPVFPVNSTSSKPTLRMRERRSSTRTAPPTQSDQASRFPATFRGRSPLRTMSAN